MCERAGELAALQALAIIPESSQTLRALNQRVHVERGSRRLDLTRAVIGVVAHNALQVIVAVPSHEQAPS